MKKIPSWLDQFIKKIRKVDPYKALSLNWKSPVFRKKVTKIFYKSVIWIIILSMTLSMGLVGLLSRFDNKGRDVAASVNGQPISSLTLGRRVGAKREQIAAVVSQFAQLGIPFDAAQLNMDPEKWAFDSLVDDLLLNEITTKLHINLDDEYVSYKLTDPYYIIQELSEFIPPYLFLTQQNLSGHNLFQLLKNQGISLQFFEKFVEKNLQRALVKDIVANAVYIPIFALKHAYVQQYAKKDFLLLCLSLDSFIKKEKESDLEDKEIKAFFDTQNAKSKRYRVAEKRSAVLWRFNPDSYNVEVTEADFRQYYDDHKSKFIKAPAKANVRRILLKVDKDDSSEEIARLEKLRAELIKDPDMFKAKAKELSQDSDTAKNGGETEWFVRKDRDPVFAKAAFRLKKPGDISPVLITADGIEILQLIDRKRMSYKPFDSVKSEIKGQVITQTFRHSFADDMDELLTKVLADPDAVDAFISKKSGKMSAVESVQKDEIDSERKTLAKKLFKMRDKDYSYYRDGDTGVLIQLSAVHEAYIPDLDSVKKEVKEDLYRSKALKSRSRALKAAQKTENFKEQADKLGGKIRTVSFVESDEKARKKMVSENLPVDEMKRLEQIGDTAIVGKGETAYLIRMDKISAFDEQDFAKKQPVLRAIIHQESRAKIAEGFVASLRRNATIDINTKIVRDDRF